MSSQTAAGPLASAISSFSELRPEVAALKKKLDAFVEEECIPSEKDYESHLRHLFGNDRWTMEAVPPCLELLKRRARELGLWNLFVPPHLVDKIPVPHLRPTVSLSYREYGVLCESLGRCPHIAPEACNTSAPDTGNMEVLLEFGTPEQQQKFLVPLLLGEIRSTFCMTEPDVASSDPTNLQTKLVVAKDKITGKRSYILKGRKWWSTGAMDPRCRFALVVARMEYPDGDDSGDKDMDEKHGAHTIVLVPLPNERVIMKRALQLFGYDDAPHGHAEVEFDNVPLDETNLIAGERSGFRVSQARLGPGRIHHCMRAIGMASRSLELMLQRAVERETFGKPLWQHGSCQELIAESVADLETARLLTLRCAAAMDDVGVKAARVQVALIKYRVPELTYRVVDSAVQLWGGAGVSDDDTVLARFLCGLRSLRIADGPDAVHKRTVALLTLKNFHQSRL